jgi:hypothetical protein
VKSLERRAGWVQVSKRSSSGSDWSALTTVCPPAERVVVVVVANKLMAAPSPGRAHLMLLPEPILALHPATTILEL